MKVVIQKASEASVHISGNLKAKIGKGLVILLGIEVQDNEDDIKWLTKKIANLRIFNDKNEVLNLSVKDVLGEILLISQFTLQASTKKGNRPSYIKAAKPDIAIPLYQKFINELELEFGKKIETGTFGANMQVALINDGPVTIIIDTKNKV